MLFLCSLVSTATLGTNRQVPSQYTTIQSAIDACVRGDCVIVAPGTYTGDGNRDIDFMGKAITVRSVAPNDPDIVAATIIDCQGTEAAPHRGFYFHTGEGPDSEVAGLTITNGYGPLEETAFGYSAGGGLFIMSSPTIYRCAIIHNYADVYGGGVYIDRLSEVLISHCWILNNTTGSYGGGIICIDPKATIRNCIISRNIAMVYGGGIRSVANDASSVLTVEHCTITDNWGKRLSGGIIASHRDIIRNSIVWNNETEGGARNVDGYPNMSYCDVQGGFPGEGNINVDPCFVGSEGGDYHLMPNSPCINAGDPQYHPNTMMGDFDGDDRIVFARTDIGADEFNRDIPYLYLSHKQFVFKALIDADNPGRQPLSVRNSGTGLLKWLIIEDCGWLNVERDVGESRGEIDEIALTVDIVGLEKGLYDSEIIVSSQNALNSHETVSVTLHIEDGDNVRHVPSEYSNIQAAINWAVPGDTILIADGTYRGDGNRDIDLLGKAITVQSENGPDLCIIDCEGTEADPHRGFIFQMDEDPNTILAGLTITNGYAERGGAIYCYGDSSPVIRRCVVVGNRAFVGGGICVYAGWSEPIIQNCVIAGNSADAGGGLYLRGGIGRGNGWWSSLVTIANCTITGNRAHSGGAAGAKFACKVVFDNSIVWYNTSTSGKHLGKPGLYDVANAFYTISYSNIEAAKDWIIKDNYSTWDQGSMDMVPQFARTGFWDPNGTPYDANDDVWVMGDYHLQSQGSRWDKVHQEWVSDDVTSPCIDAGNPEVGLGQELATAPDDPNGLWSENIRINMGAYGGTAEASLAPLGFSPLLKAWNPKPEDGAIVYNDRVLLSWSTMHAVSSDVYFGPNEPGQMQYMGRQAETTYDPGPLEYDTTYYWRVDEIGPFGDIKGDVWHFTVRKSGR